MRVCGFPGCGVSLEGRHKTCIWCDACSKAMHAIRRKRHEGTRIRQSRGHVAGYGHHVRGTGTMRSHEQPRVPQKKCSDCGGMPWAREPGRYTEGGMGTRHEIAPNWVCVGCGERYAPEPPVELCGTVRSSAGMAVDHGKYYGGEPACPYHAAPTGKRKGAK